MKKIKKTLHAHLKKGYHHSFSNMYTLPLLIIIGGFLGLTFYSTYKTAVHEKSNISKINEKTNPTPHVADDSDKLTAPEYEMIKNKLTGIVQTQDPRAALVTLRNQTNIDPKVIQYCHGLTHEIGHAAYKKYGFVQALTYMDDLCGSGYIHGIIESDFSGTKDLTTKLHTICQTAILSNEYGNCYHGVGHGLMFYTNNNIPQSLSYCDTYTDMTQRSLCSEGVFMENFNSDTLFHPTKYLDPKNPFFPCPQESSFYKDACYFYATDYYLHLHQSDYTGAIKWCDGAEKGYVQTCMRGVGSRTIKYNSGTPKYVEKVCMTAHAQKNINACIDGMVSYFLVQYNSVTRAKTICGEMDKANQSACFLGIQNRSIHFLN